MADNPQEKQLQDKELEFVQSQQDTIMPEEFPDGPYGAKAYVDQKLGKSSPWKPNQQVTSSHQDENPAFTDKLANPRNEELPDL